MPDSVYLMKFLFKRLMLWNIAQIVESSWRKATDSAQNVDMIFNNPHKDREKLHYLQKPEKSGKRSYFS